ncbi:MAG: hypothetical protein JWQ90_3366 [Hydrocarboniphaga sp.]|uniref:DUF423 domain-containing protein n=1 Tax=Hydrocarboniphaga sp. TaxID=2033016 RepID=UPI00263862DD|nr:DUF423 domain-containing protein [Hydrocarboniphaga sp.]MDB5970916.1 hypothetical protein [Hydrocarboniphaga sp.]
MSKLWLSFSSIYGMLAVLLGAFGAHALKAQLSPDLLAVWKTANEYQFYHALALGLVGLLLRGAPDRAPDQALNAAGACFVIGVLVFCGSLYALALSNLRLLGAITPIGGLLFIAGWALLFYSVARR